MKDHSKKIITLGIVFIFQAVTALVSEAALLTPLIVQEDIVQTMKNISENNMNIQLNIILQLATAIGIMILAIVMYSVIKDTHKIMAQVALALYFLEATILAVSRINTYSLMSLADMYDAAPSEVIASIALTQMTSMDFGYTLHMIPFCIGALIFYQLLYKSQVIPRYLSLWGRVGVIGCLFVTICTLLNIDVPFYICLPYVPFEFYIGIWLIVHRRNQVRVGGIT